jgi:hypothetical protein
VCSSQYHTVDGTNTVVPIMSLDEDFEKLALSGAKSFDPVTAASMKGKKPSLGDVKKSIKVIILSVYSLSYAYFFSHWSCVSCRLLQVWKRCLVSSLYKPLESILMHWDQYAVTRLSNYFTTTTHLMITSRLISVLVILIRINGFSPRIAKGRSQRSGVLGPCTLRFMGADDICSIYVLD